VAAQGMFVEQVLVPQKDKEKKPEPELKQLIPLVFPDNKVDSGTTDVVTEDLFAPIFVEDNQEVIHKSVVAQRTMPLDAENITGVSTYFSRFHPGIDYRAKMGTAVRAILPGVVNEVGFQRGGYGRFVILIHYAEGKTLFSLYAHLKEAKVNVGEKVESGDIIGAVGLTGRSTGPHLHFELHDTKSAMDPIRFFANKALAMVMKK